MTIPTTKESDHVHHYPDIGQYLAHKGITDRQTLATVKSLNLEQLPWTWWASLAKVVKSTLAQEGPGGLIKRFETIKGHLDYLSGFKLHIMSTPQQIRKEYLGKVKSIDVNANLPDFVISLAQATEHIARDLLINRISGNKKMSKETSRFMEIREHFQIESFNNTYPHLTRDQAKSAYLDRLKARCIDVKHRQKETALFCYEDLSWVGRVFYITLPSMYHPGPINGRINEEWIMAGRPSPKDGYDALLEVIQAARKKAATKKILIVGHRLTEVQSFGRPHLNMLVHFKDDADAAEFEKILREKYASRFQSIDGTQRHRHDRGGFKIRSEPIVTRVLKSKEDTLQASWYVSKNMDYDVNHAPEQTATNENGNRNSQDLFARSLCPENQYRHRAPEKPKEASDRMVCALWKINQHGEWQTGRKQFVWSRMREISEHQINECQARDVIPPSLLAIWQAANPQHRSYRSFLRLTHPLTPIHKQIPVWLDDMVDNMNTTRKPLGAYPSNRFRTSTPIPITVLKHDCGYLSLGQSCILYLTSETDNRIIFVRLRPTPLMKKNNNSTAPPD